MHTPAQRNFVRSSTTALLSATLALSFLTGCAGRMARQEQENQQEQQEAVKTQEPAKAQELAKSQDVAKTQDGPAQSQPATPVAQAPQVSETRVTTLRLEALEAKLAAMNDKLDSTRVALDSFLVAHQPKSAGVPIHAAETAGKPLASKPVAGDSESGFVNDEAIQQFRKALVLLDSQRYADSVLVLSNFLERYPDHPLAGSAQFHLGEAYYKQKSWHQADQEFQKVLTSYDRSIHVSDTLRMIAESEDHLGKTQDAARHRQQLSSLFANSPAAAQAMAEPAPAAEAQAAEVSAPETAPATAPASVAPAAAHEMAPANTAKRPGLDEPPPTAPVTAPTE